jgi:putative multiple sugar transport system substrate-binding protein
MRRITFAAAGVVLALTLAACSGSGAGGGAGAKETATSGSGGGKGTLVGVAMPTQTSERWIADGNAVKKGLESAGYKVDLEYGNDDIPTQQQQIDQMITKGAGLLIIASIDGTALANQLQAAADKHIPVIAYDRLIRDSQNVDFYVTFDNYKVGVQQATSLLEGLGLLKEDGKTKGDKTGPFNVELFAGSLDDNNAHFFWQGAMDTLKPYLDAGTIVVPSGQVTIDKAAILRWQQETAQKRMEDLLTAHYASGKKVDGVLSPYDGLSRGIITALQNDPSNKYGSAVPMPIVTGQDAEIASVKLINDGVQYSTIFKDTRKLADQAVVASKAFLGGQTPEPNDTKSYDNGKKVVPSYLLQSDVVNKGNIKPLLIDSGYWTADEVAAGKAAS